MSKEEIERLLGGYATNSLTVEERKALFEAALDDQELFDALERDQSLKELLDDPAWRREIHGALLSPLAAPAPRRTRRWAWSLVGSVAAASILFALLVRPPPAPKPVAAVIEPKPMDRLEAPPPAVERRAASKLMSVKAPQPTPPPAPSPALRYTILRREEDGSYSRVASENAVQPGDSVRVDVQPPAPGVLTLFELDAGGAWKKLEGLPVSANTSYTVPGVPIDVASGEQLRLVFAPAVAAEPAGKIKKKMELPASRVDLSEPVVVDIRLGSKHE
jgi:hypothetical protein